MRNHECEIRFISARGSVQRWHKRGSAGPWIEASGTGNEYEATAEQFISHLLPALLPRSDVTVEVRRKS